MKQFIKYFSYLVLLALIVFSLLVFFGQVSTETNKLITLVLTIAWFASAPVWMLSQKS